MRILDNPKRENWFNSLAIYHWFLIKKEKNFMLVENFLEICSFLVIRNPQSQDSSSLKSKRLFIIERWGIISWGWLEALNTYLESSCFSFYLLYYHKKKLYWTRLSSRRLNKALLIKFIIKNIIWNLSSIFVFVWEFEWRLFLVFSGIFIYISILYGTDNRDIYPLFAIDWRNSSISRPNAICSSK